MRAAYKWRLNVTTYAYITDEQGGEPFIYNSDTKERVYSGTTKTEETDDSEISKKVSDFEFDKFEENFVKVTEMVKGIDPSFIFQDVTYYYNISNDSCVRAVEEIAKGDDGNDGQDGISSNIYNQFIFIPVDKDNVAKEDIPVQTVRVKLFDTKNNNIQSDINEFKSGATPSGVVDYLTPQTPSVYKITFVNGGHDVTINEPVQISYTLSLTGDRSGQTYTFYTYVIPVKEGTVTTEKGETITVEGPAGKDGVTANVAGQFYFVNVDKNNSYGKTIDPHAFTVALTDSKGNAISFGTPSYNFNSNVISGVTYTGNTFTCSFKTDTLTSAEEVKISLPLTGDRSGQTYTTSAYVVPVKNNETTTIINNGEGSTVALSSSNDKYFLLGNDENNSDSILADAKYNSNVYAQNGNMHATAYYIDSDERLKDVVGNAEFDINKLLDLSIVYFNYKQDDTKKTHLGVIAQEIYDICPEIVNVDHNGYMSVEYDKLGLLALYILKKIYKDERG